MRWGSLHLYCPMCGQRFLYDPNRPPLSYHHREFGILCGKDCYDAAELSHARIILGKDGA